MQENRARSRRDADVRRQRERQPRAHGRAVDGGDDGLRNAPHAGGQPLYPQRAVHRRAGRPLAGERQAHLGQVSAGAEAAPRAGQDERAHLGEEAAHFHQRGVKFGSQLAAQRVHHVGAVQRDQRGVAVAFQCQGLVVHAQTSPCRGLPAVGPARPPPS